jgi:hypothetical protein
MAQSEYAPDVASIDLPESLGIMVLSALYYAIQTKPFRLPGFVRAVVRSLRAIPLGIHKAIRRSAKKITTFWGKIWSAVREIR